MIPTRLMGGYGLRLEGGGTQMYMKVCILK
jgi:hypothetical protein